MSVGPASAPTSMPVTWQETKITSPSQGRSLVYFIRQYHVVAGLPDNLADLITKYQRDVLRYLVLKRPKHVFVEGNFKNYTPAKKLSGYDKEVCYSVKRHFPNGIIPDDLTPLQNTDLLFGMGAAQVYYCMFDDVYLHPTTTRRQEFAIGRRVDELGGSTEALRREPDLVNTARERIAVGQMKRFMGKINYKSVALLFGSGHDFTDDFERFLKGVGITEVTFPQACENISREFPQLRSR